MVNLLTQAEVEQLCLNVGFNEKNAKIASAIAMCESAFAQDGQQFANAHAIGDQALANDTWGYSYGLFQVRSLRSQKGTGDYRDENELLRPRFNARSAKKIFNTQGWKAWSVFSSGMYKAYLQDMFPPPEGTYVVLSGDTLSGIAAAHDLSWADLARWNNIHEPYTIFIGQILLLKDPIGA